MHRDIKPLNVFLTKNYDVKVLVIHLKIKLGDMGISKIFNDSQP